MATAWGFAASAVLAGFALGAAGPAWADTPTMDGSYTETSTSPGGKAMTTSWSVNSCGDGCVYVKAGAGGTQAHLIDGQWVMDSMNDLSCPDGTYVLYATSSHTTWDPNTLAGTAQLTNIIPACGRPPGYTQTNQIQIKQSS